MEHLHLYKQLLCEKLFLYCVSVSTSSRSEQSCRYLNDKDLFERFYKQHLSKRLLSSRVASDEMEQLMLSKLKAECGYQFTSKLESMFTDMRTSADTMTVFRTHVKENNLDLGIDLHVQVHST
jgi:cullin 3